MRKFINIVREAQLPPVGYIATNIVWPQSAHEWLAAHGGSAPYGGEEDGVLGFDEDEQAYFNEFPTSTTVAVPADVDLANTQEMVGDQLRRTYGAVPVSFDYSRADSLHENTRPTATKTSTRAALSSLMPQADAGALATTSPTAGGLRNAGSERTKAALAAAASSDHVRELRNQLGAQGGAHALMRDLERMNAGTTDRISDEHAARLVGTTPAALGHQGVEQHQLAAPTNAIVPTGAPTTPENLPATIKAMLHGETEHLSGEVMSRGQLATLNTNLPDQTFDPEWHMVRDLPAYILNGVRQVARQIFTMWTHTDIEDVQTMNTLMNPATDVQKMAAWIVNNGTLVRDADIDFATTMPSYAALAGLAECKIYGAGGYQFCIMRDRGGHYIYGWPESDAVHETPRLGGPSAPQLGNG